MSTLPLPPMVLVFQAPQSGTHCHLAFVTSSANTFRCLLKTKTRCFQQTFGSPYVPQIWPLADIVHS